MHPFFWVVAGAVLVLSYLVLEPFLSMALLAFVVATLFSGYYEWLLKKFKGGKSKASLVGTLSLMVVFLIPSGGCRGVPMV